MQGVKFYIKFDQNGNKLLENEINPRVRKSLGENFGGVENVVIYSDEKTPPYIDGILKVEIPVRIKNISIGQVTPQKLEKILAGLLDGYPQYSNLKIEITN